MTRGFTMVEILIAVVLTSIGFAAIFSLQIASIQGNVAAREVSSAVNLAERYVEVLRAESHVWVAGPWQQGENPSTDHLAQTAELWHSFTPDPIDHNGRAFIDDDRENGSQLARQRFCVHYWINPLGGAYEGVINARVRVIWPRASLDQTGLDDACSRPQDFEESVRTWYTITVPATLRRHPST